MVRRSALSDKPAEHIEHIGACDRTVRTKAEALAGMLVDDGQTLESTPIDEPVMDEIPSPHIVFAGGHTLVASVGCVAYSPLFPHLSGHFKPLALPQAVNPFLVYPPAFGTQQRRHVSTAPPRIVLNHLMQPSHQSGFIIGRPGLVALC